MIEERQTRQMIAYVSVYEVSRQYGGPEEGGWWYDSYEWLKVSIPFRAIQDLRWIDSDDHVMMPGWWENAGPPRPADFPAQVRLDSAYSYLMELYGEETRTRGSVLSTGDVEFIIERSPGERGEWPRPRFE